MSKIFLPANNHFKTFIAKDLFWVPMNILGNSVYSAEEIESICNLEPTKTAVFISHRMSSTRFCDRIILFQAGKIIETGTHEKLMAQKGKYYELFQMQAQYYVKL